MFFYRFFRISVCLIFEILVRRIAARIAARDERIGQVGGAVRDKGAWIAAWIAASGVRCVKLLEWV